MSAVTRKGRSGSILGRIRRTKRGESKLMQLPQNLVAPEKVAVFSGPEESDVWPALYMTNMLEQAYSHVHLTVLCCKRDGDLFNMLRWRPRVHFYQDSPAMPQLEGDEALTDGTLLFYPYTGLSDNASALLADSGAGIRIAPLSQDSPNVNLRVRVVSKSYPGILFEMSQILGIGSQPEWKPRVQHQAHDQASELMAPISGRSMPYFVTSTGALSILEKNRAEIPLRTVSLAGRNVEFQDLNRELRAAIIAGASAVATDSPDLWGDACALGVPVVGLDPGGRFMKWDTCQTHDNTAEFLEAWAALLRIGW